MKFGLISAIICEDSLKGRRGFFMRKRFLSCALAVCLVLGLFAPLEGLTLRAEAVTA